MPILPTSVVDGTGDKPYRVLLTGFGPFGRFAVNPSWLAVKPLHNVILDTKPTAVTHEKEVVMDANAPKRIHITALQVPTEYQFVLSTVPGFHTRPPVLPESDNPALPSVPPPEDGYDLVFHVGVAGIGTIRMETLGHKYGYQLPDAAGKLAPIVPEESDDHTVTDAERMERARLDGIKDGRGKGPLRGFTKGYEPFAKEIYSKVDVDGLVAYLKATVEERTRVSTDAGRYLCDFTYYCSLAERQRQKDSGGKRTKVLFFHCPPVGEPLNTEQTTEIIKRTIIWVSQH